MEKFVWISGGSAQIVEAENREDAIRRVIATRCNTEDLKGAISSFMERDTVLPLVNSETDGVEPFVGELPQDVLRDAVEPIGSYWV